MTGKVVRLSQDIDHTNRRESTCETEVHEGVEDLGRVSPEYRLALGHRGLGVIVGRSETRSGFRRSGGRSGERRDRGWRYPRDLGALSIYRLGIDVLGVPLPRTNGHIPLDRRWAVRGVAAGLGARPFLAAIGERGRRRRIADHLHVAS